ncbi:MAG TPA: transglycosylase SLT domain-containing protein [Longimicrobium sp.]|nr:transglycosylase SLT domain-containing protein [Longimicrobium sp.]
MRRARAAIGRMGARPWLLAALALLLAVLPPTRALGRRAWEVTRDAIAAVRAAEARERVVAAYARQYGIPMELAAAIERAARAEGVEAKLAFRLVRVESAFHERAESSVGALGLTQLMPATAREMQPGITRAEILHRDTNLRLGFRYFGRLLAYYDGDEEEALTAYNRGPGTVARIRGSGGDPSNGYAELVLGPRGGSPVNRVRHDSAGIPAAPPLHEVGPARPPSGL